MSYKLCSMRKSATVDEGRMKEAKYVCTFLGGMSAAAIVVLLFLTFLMDTDKYDVERLYSCLQVVENSTVTSSQIEICTKMAEVKE